MPQLPETTDDRLTRVDTELSDRITITDEKVTAIAGMHDQLERLVEVLQGQLFALQAVVAQLQGKEPIEGCPVPSADAVDCADMQYLSESIFGAIAGAKQVQDGVDGRKPQ